MASDRPRRVTPVGVAAAGAALFSGAVGFAPLFGGPGYEHALACGLVLPTLAAVAVAFDGLARRDRSLLDLVVRAAGVGLLVALVAHAVALLHALRTHACDVPSGVALWWCGPGVGTVLGATWGVVAGEAARLREAPRRAAVAFAALAPLSSVAVSIVRFYRTPAVFAYDPFVGYFSGTLYDTVIDHGGALYTYRLGSLFSLSAVWLAASVLERSPSGSPPIARVALGGRALLRLGAAALVGAASVGLALSAGSLGHTATRATLEAALGQVAYGRRCDVFVPKSVDAAAAALLARDCDEQLGEVDRFFGTQTDGRVTAFFFDSAESKKALMGAAQTYIAKPWRREVYLQVAPYPHPVLGHELAHVVAGTFARGPFRVAGSLGGLWPNPGLIEGAAVAASPPLDDMTPELWARSMLDLELLPPTSDLFSMGFLGGASARSYTAAGAFVGWVRQQKGPEVLRKWYGGVPLEDLFGAPWPTIETSYAEYLRKLRVVPEAKAYAEARFRAKGVFGRRCPHEVDALRAEADACAEGRRAAEAIRLYDVVLRLDGGEHHSALARARVERMLGDRAKGREALEAMSANEDLPRPVRDRADEALGDAAWLEGDLSTAQQRFERVAGRAFDEDLGRTAAVKAEAVKSPDAAAAVRALLLGDGEHGPSPFIGAGELGLWQGKSESSLGLYLLGRSFVNQGRYARGGELLARALELEIVDARVAREALRLRAVAACVSGDRMVLARIGAAAMNPDGPYAISAGGRRDALVRFIGRCGSELERR